MVSVLKSMRFRRLYDRSNGIVLKTLHSSQRFQIVLVSPRVSTLPRSQTSLFFSRNKGARKGPREGEKARDCVSPLSFLLPVIPRKLVPSFSCF